MSMRKSHSYMSQNLDDVGDMVEGPFEGGNIYED